MTDGCKGRVIIVYVKEGLNFVKRDTVSGLHEYLVVNISLSTGVTLTVCIFYRSPNSSDEKILRLLQGISECAGIHVQGEKVKLFGDFNLPRINCSLVRAPNGSFEETFLNTLMDNFLFQHIKEVKEESSC